MRITSGKVVSNKKFQEGTLTVSVQRRFRHPLYEKTITTYKKYIVHHPSKAFIELGTMVNITQCRPISKRKKWEVCK